MDALERPSGACITCAPPFDARSWRMAYSGHFTCETCEDTLTSTLVEIADRYEQLDSTPGAGGLDGGRGAPGFESRSPANEHVIVIRDARSSQVAKVWLGGDGRIHRESERPPLSVYSTLLSEVYDVAERRGMSLPNPIDQVRNLTAWLDRHVSWLTAQDTALAFYEAITSLSSQLRPLTGDPHPKNIGKCPKVVEGKRCSATLYAPTRGDTIRCWECKYEWPYSEWLRLADLLESA